MHNVYIEAKKITNPESDLPSIGTEVLELGYRMRDQIHESTSVERRSFLHGPLISVLASWILGQRARASKLDPAQTIITLPSAIQWIEWSGLPPHSGEMATLYGDLDRAGTYVVLMKWYPGYMSAPHHYATDRLSVVLSGNWWVNSGRDFDPDNCVAVPAGGFVERIAHTWHYDGVKEGAAEPAVIAIFGSGPVDLKLADPNKPVWRRV